MSKYEKPTIVKVDTMAEGIYMASGTTANVCGSRYMNGVWQRSLIDNSTGIGNSNEETAKTNNVGDYYGCAGCPCNTGSGCDLSRGIETSKNIPVWETMGYDYEYFPAYGSLSF